MIFSDILHGIPTVATQKGRQPHLWLSSLIIELSDESFSRSPQDLSSVHR